jgi:deoxyribodipyrimidine photo-lyase
MTAIVWIRRSLREHDNTALVEACKEHDEVVPLYVVDRDYFEKSKLGYPRVRFWQESLKEFKEILGSQKDKKLIIRNGEPLKELRNIVEEVEADEVYHNRDYTPYSRRRDQKAKNELDVPVRTFKDIVMFEKKEILTNSDTPYKVYTYYSKKWFDREKRRPQKAGDYRVPVAKSRSIPSVKELGFEKPEGLEWAWNPGREGGKARLESFKDKILDYDRDRDYAWKEGTSKLSPHFKFGTVSIREAFWEAERIKARNQGEDSSGVKTWQEELAWRDFYMQVLWNWPETTEKPFLDQYEEIDWRSKEDVEKEWSAWVNGRTGVPFVDAGMRQLKKTGWMHNRLRMVVTSFACKDLWLDWKDVHEYFKRMFVDAEIASMVGGIQWAYSIGTDAQPYFRVFNPFTQGEDYDPDGKYIREWVPELEDVPDEHIHKPHEMNKLEQEDCNLVIGEDYPKPIVDHDSKRKKAVKKFEQAKEQ